MRGCQTFEQKWWSLFGKYWLVKNERNDEDVKVMQWLMTGGNHGTIDTCGENLSVNCNEVYHEKMNHSGSEGECIGSSWLINANSINTPTKLLKLELVSQIPIKSPFKLKRDVLKVEKRIIGTLKMVLIQMWKDWVISGISIMQ